MTALVFLFRLVFLARFYAPDEERGPRSMPPRILRWFVGTSRR